MVQRLSEKFLVRPEVILRPEPQFYDTYAVFNHRTCMTEFLSEEECRALQYIYERSADISTIALQSNMTGKSCRKFLDRMVKLGYVLANADDPMVKPPERLAVKREAYRSFSLSFLSAPTSVDIFVTNRCNLKCVHCFSSKDDKMIHELSLEKLESIFDQLEKLGVLEVRINGGEPLLHPEIHEILEALGRRKFRRVILTNGTLLGKEILTLLRQANVIPTISLDGSKAEQHDAFRGVKKSFDDTIKALELLHEANIEYGINCCLHKKNLATYEDIIDLAVKYGSYRISFLDLKISNTLRRHLDWVPSYKEYQEIVPYLVLSRARYRTKIDVSLSTFMHCYPLEEAVAEVRNGYVSCKAGRTRLSIDCDGSVYPCNLVISDPRWAMGNIEDQRILDIWFSQKWSFFRGDVKISDLILCRNCKDSDKCQDFFCRLLPYLENGNPFGPHPKCR